MRPREYIPRAIGYAFLILALCAFIAQLWLPTCICGAIAGIALAISDHAPTTQSPPGDPQP